MKLRFLVFLTLLGNYVCLGQSKALNIEFQYLKDVVSDLELFYDIKLSYVDDLVSDKIISIEATQDTPLINVLSSLEKQTQLRFEEVGDGYVIIRNYTNKDSVDVCGYIRDINKLPIEGVVVLPEKSKKGAITDENGYFELKGIPFSSRIVYQHVGYNSRQIKAVKFIVPECLRVTLLESVQMLQEVVVKDYLNTGISKKQKDITIRPADLKHLPGIIEPDILQSIQQSPGINSPFETASGIHVRGGAPDQNLVLWNGIKTYNQGHFFGMLSAFNPYLAESVTFIKNGTSARYGDRVSGVIDIRTSQNAASEISGGAGFNMIYADAYSTIPLIKDKLSVQVSGRRSYTDAIETPTYNQMSNRVFQNTKITSNQEDVGEQGENDFFFNDFTSNMVFQPTKDHRIIINGIYNKNSLDFTSRNPNTSQDFNDKLDNQNEGYNLQYSFKNQSPFTFNFETYLARYALTYEFRNIQNDTVEVSSKRNFISDYGGKAMAGYAFDDQKLQAGYEYSNNSIRYAFQQFTPLYDLTLDADSGEVSTHSFFIEHLLNTKKVTLESGIRYNRFKELDESTFEPRLFASYHISDLLSINGTLEYKSQAASQIKESVVSDLSLENQIWTLSSLDRFPIIKSYQYSLGTTFEYDDWYLDADVYVKNIDGVTTLTFGFLNPNPLDQEFRIGESDIWGTDVFLKKYFGDYNSWLSYSYINTQNTFTGLNNDEAFPGNWNIQHTVKWSHFYKVKDFEFSLGWIWHSGKSFTEVVLEETEGPVAISFNGINEDKLPVYHRLDFSAVYEIKTRSTLRYRIGLSVQNLYNRENILNREFKTTPSLENELIDTEILSLGITPNLVFRVFW